MLQFLEFKHSNGGGKFDLADVTLFLGPPSSGKTKAMIAELSKIEPFSYTFIGSQGEFVKFVAQMASKEIGIINRSAFKTLDQFAVDLVVEQKGLVFADEALKLSVLSSVIEDMSSKNLDFPDEIVKLKHRSTVEKLLSLIDDIKSYMKEDEFKEPQTRMDFFISSVMELFKKALNSKNLFDTYDAYAMIANGEIELNGKYLFVDGFYDFTPVVSKLFKTLISHSKKTFITATQGEIFKRGTSTILKTVEEFNPRKVNFQFKGSQVARGLFFGNGENLHVHAFEKITDEINWVCGKVKRLLLNGRSPDDFEIVVNSSSSDYVEALKEKLEEYSIEVSYLGKKSLSQNVVVQQLMLPIRVVTNGYPPDLLNSMMMVGYGGKEKGFSLIYDLARLNRGPIRLSHDMRLKNWMEKIDRFTDFLRKKKSFVENSDEEYNQKATLEEIERLLSFADESRKTVESLFDFLLDFENAKGISEYTKAFEKAIEVVKKRELSQDDMEAIKSFKELLWEVEGIWSFTGVSEITSLDYRYYLELQLKERFYIPEENELSVRISDVLTSRFSHKPLKIFVGFNDGNYPQFHQNYFYTTIEEENHFGENRILKSLFDNRLDLYTAMSHASEVYLTMPTSTVSGIKILPSIYLTELEEKFDTAIDEAEEIPPMSAQEAVIAYAKWARENGRSPEIEKKLGVEMPRVQEYNLKDEANLSFCGKMSEKPVSFYKFSYYDKCPLMFFFAYVLKIPQEIAYTFDLDALEIGTIYHNVLKKMMKRGRDALMRKTYDEVYAMTKEFVKEELEKITFLEEELFKINLARISAVITEYLFNVELRDPQELKSNMKKYMIYQNKAKKTEEFFVPYRFEFSIDGANGELGGIKFVGRIDRIDTCPSGLMIVDYKRKNQGEKEQLCIYSAIAQKMLNRPVLQATFSLIEAQKISSLISSEKIQKETERTLSKVKEFLESVQKGKFNSKNACKRCPYSMICPERREK